MKNQRLILFAVVALTTASAGCATTRDRFSVISTRNNTGLDGPAADAKSVSGESCRRSILFIPITGRDSLGDAVDEALAKAPGASMLTDAKVESEMLFTFFYNYHCQHIEGRPLTVAQAHH